MALRKLLTGVIAPATLILATLGGVGSGPAANASSDATQTTHTAAVNQPYAANCPRGLFCTWWSANFAGLRTTAQAVAPGSCRNWPSMRSAYNRTGIPQNLWTGFNCTGKSRRINNGAAIGGGVYHSVGGYP